MPSNGLPDDWRYCTDHLSFTCAGCGRKETTVGVDAVERKAGRRWEHWHSSCALERALWLIQKFSKPRGIRYKWKPKEPSL